MNHPKSSLKLWSAADLGAFFVEHRSEFVAHARRVTTTSAEAEEIVQDALVKVLLACPDLESPNHAKAYFHRVIENLAIDIHRRNGRQPKLVVLDDASTELEAQWSVDPDHAEMVAAADDAAIIREAISFLSPAERAALVMWEFEGRPVSEIARELGVKESAVKHTVARARTRLRRILAERIIDEKHGFTALDVLSVTFRKVENVAQRSSKVALSLILVLAAFLGFSSLSPRDFVPNQVAIQVEQPSKEGLDSSIGISDETPTESQNESVEIRSNVISDSKSSLSQESLSALPVDDSYFGLDSEGVPTGFTVIDSKGSSGILFTGQQNVIRTETGLLLSNIASTRSGAVNVLLDQSVILDAFGTSYVAEVSVGINGGWQPLVLSYISSDVERLASGNYLLTAMLVVDSAVETAVKVPTGATGTDLSSAPEYLSTKVLMDPTKTRILAQAVLVSADSQGDGA